MLTALPNTKQNEGEPKRRWYFSDSLDLYVWFDEAEVPCAFQLTYARGAQEQAVSWHHLRGYQHWRVEQWRLQTPELIPDGPLDRDRLLADFISEAEQLPASVRHCVMAHLERFPEARIRTLPTTTAASREAAGGTRP
jgi:hypothetical protein